MPRSFVQKTCPGFAGPLVVGVAVSGWGHRSLRYETNSEYRPPNDSLLLGDEIVLLFYAAAAPNDAPRIFGIANAAGFVKIADLP